jgi:hypothetical protein
MSKHVLEKARQLISLSLATKKYWISCSKTKISLMKANQDNVLRENIYSTKNPDKCHSNSNFLEEKPGKDWAPLMSGKGPVITKSSTCAKPSQDAKLV